MTYYFLFLQEIYNLVNKYESLLSNQPTREKLIDSS